MERPLPPNTPELEYCEWLEAITPIFLEQIALMQKDGYMNLTPDQIAEIRIQKEADYLNRLAAK